MIEIKESPELYQAPSGYVIIEVPYLVKEESNGLSHTLYADESIGSYTVRSGVVFSTSTSDVEGLNFYHDCEVQVKKGDKVWFTPNSISGLATTGGQHWKVIKHKERIFVVLPYKFLVMKLVAGEYIGLNDYVITEVVNEKQSMLNVDELEGNGRLHKVVAVPMKGVTYRPTRNDADTPVEVKVGDIVLLRINRRMFLENENDMQLPARWCAQQSRYIMAKTA